MHLKLVSDFGDEPVSLEEAKIQCRYTADDQDTYIGGLIMAGRIIAELYNGRQLTLKQWILALDHWPSTPVTGISAIPNPYFGFWPSDAYRLLAGIRPEVSGIELAAPLISVDNFTWKDYNGNVNQLVNGTDYVVDTFKEPGIVCPAPNQNWPVTGLWPTSAIQITFTSGMVPDAVAYMAQTPPPPNPVPEVGRHLKQAILMLVAQWFEDRIPFDAIRNVAEVPFSVSALLESDKLWFT